MPGALEALDAILQGVDGGTLTAPEAIEQLLTAQTQLRNNRRLQAAMRSSQFMREKWKDLEDQSRERAKTAGVTIVTDFDRKPFEAAMAAIYAKAQRDSAAAELIQRIRKVE